MTPYQFKQARKLYGQTQAEWADTLGFDGSYSGETVGRYERANVKIPRMVAKLVTLLVDRRLADMRKTLINAE